MIGFAGVVKQLALSSLVPTDYRSAARSRYGTTNCCFWGTFDFCSTLVSRTHCGRSNLDGFDSLDAGDLIRKPDDPESLIKGTCWEVRRVNEGQVLVGFEPTSPRLLIGRELSGLLERPPANRNRIRSYMACYLDETGDHEGLDEGCTKAITSYPVFCVDLSGPDSWIELIREETTGRIVRLTIRNATATTPESLGDDLDLIEGLLWSVQEPMKVSITGLHPGWN